jgi:tripartite-type tricarboxylate transporter receptor subunit TctC
MQGREYMKLSKRGIGRTVLLATATLLCTGVLAQPATRLQPSSWPTKPLRILVGFPAGSTPDLVPRTLAQPLSRALGQPVVVENRVGAGGNIAADAVAKSTDQHTIGVMINGNLTIAKLLSPATPYDPHQDLAPISLIGTAPLLLTTAANTPFNTVQEFFAAARQSGQTWSYGTPGVGTVSHIGMELLKSKTHIHPVHVPYPGNPQVVQAMVGNQIQLSLLPPGLAGVQIRAGRLKAVGVTSSGRSTLVPEYASLNEAGVEGFQLEIWTAAAGPASLPQPIVAKLSGLISEISRSQVVRRQLFEQGWQVVGSSAQGLANRIQADTALFGGVIAQHGIQAR